MRVLICGDRKWGFNDDYEYKMIHDQLVWLQSIHGDDLVIITGGANGADSFAKWTCESLGIKCIEYKAAWSCLDDSCESIDDDGNVHHRDVHGRAAGPIRNKKMLDEGQPDLVMAFHNDITKSKGTKNMIQQAKKAGVPALVFPVLVSDGRENVLESEGSLNER